MSNNETHKTFTLKPHEILHQKTLKPVENPEQVLEKLKQDLTTATDLAEWCLQTDPHLLTDINNARNSKNTAIAREIGLCIPKNIIGSGTGSSRFEELIRDRVIIEAKTWNERVKAFNGVSGKYMSSGWKRTVNPMRPTRLTPKLNLASADKAYSEIINNPLVDGHLDLKLVINKQWYILRFNGFNKRRFKDCNKITKPVIRLAKNGGLSFDFTAVYPYNFANITSDYIVSVDVGITNYVTLGVYRVSTGNIIYSSTLSQRVHSLANSVRASESQKKSLYKLGRFGESALHRRAAARKKRELAIMAAGEIAQIAKEYDNSVVVFEDLSWVKNTMQNGRWNRGELVKWSKHFVELNGSRVFKVNPSMTSQWCYLCPSGQEILFLDYHTVVCPSCGVVEDRDVNATGNIAKRFVSTLSKVVTTRKKSRGYVSVSPQLSPVTRSSLRYPGRDRSKFTPTPKNARRKFNGDRGRCLPVIKVSDSATGPGDRTIVVDGLESKSSSGTRGAVRTVNDVSVANIAQHNT